MYCYTLICYLYANVLSMVISNKYINRLLISALTFDSINYDILNSIFELLTTSVLIYFNDLMRVVCFDYFFRVHDCHA